MSTEDQKVLLSPKFSVTVPDNILSPPTSRSNSPVDDMNFPNSKKDSTTEDSDVKEITEVHFAVQHLFYNCKYSRWPQLAVNIKVKT